MTQNNKIAKNTAFLYVRMLFSMGITFYSSRIILQALGVTDFGVYNIVGGIVTIFAFLQSALSGATSSYFSFYIGKEDDDSLKRFFSNALLLHLIVAVVFIILGETVGLYFVKNVIVIPAARYQAAIWVYQASLFTTFISIVTLPYTSLVISFEKMGFYAFQGIIKSILVLLVSLLVLWFGNDKLIGYSFYLFIISIIIFLINFWFVKRKISKKFVLYFKFENEIVKPLLHFFGWDLYGNFSYLINNQGISVILNVFFGAIINASIGVANQVNAAVSVFVNSFMMAVKPQIVKSYALKDYKRLQFLIEQLSRLSFYLILILAIPLLFKVDMLLKLWLGDVPEYTNSIASVIVACSFMNVFILPFGYVIHATGKMKRISFISGSFYLMVIPISYFLLQWRSNYLIPYIVNFFALVLVSLNNIYTVKLYIKEIDLSSFFKNAILPMIYCSIICLCIAFCLDHFLYGSILIDFGMMIIVTIINIVILYFIGLKQKEKDLIVSFVRNGINLFK